MNTRVSLIELDREQSTLLRGLGILMVLLGHIGCVPYGGASGVAIFLVQSGYGLNASCTDRGLAGYWGKRLRKVYLPYLTIGVFDVLALRVKGLGPVLCTLLGLDLNLIADKTMWYVSYILVWYLLYYLAALLTRGVRKPLLREAGKLAFLLPCAYGLMRLYHLGFWHAASAANFYVLAFPLGVLLSDLRGLKVSERARSCLWFGVLLLSTAWLFGLYPFRENSLIMPNAVAVQAIAVLQLCRPRRRIGALLRWFGTYSYAIYLVEGLILTVRYTWFAPLGQPVLIELAFLAVSALCGALFWNCYRRLEAALFDR